MTERDHDHHDARYDEAKRIFRDRGLTLGHVTAEEVKARVVAYEQKYGIASDNVHAAIDDGTIEETLEVCSWLMDYDLLKRLRRGATA